MLLRNRGKLSIVESLHHDLRVKKLIVDFDEDGNPIGRHPSLYYCFLVFHVQNHLICPIQVNAFEDFKSEMLDHLRSCILIIFLSSNV